MVSTKNMKEKKQSNKQKNVFYIGNIRTINNNDY